MKVLIDTNIVLDLLLDREPFSENASAVFAHIEHSRVEASLCATTLTTLDYLLGRSLSAKQARQTIQRLLELFEIATVNRSVIEEALASRMTDFEDSVLAYSANLAGADLIVTRNTKDFRRSPVKAVTPTEFLAVFSA